MNPRSPSPAPARLWPQRLAVPGWVLETVRTLLLTAAVAVLLADAADAHDHPAPQPLQAPTPGVQTPWRIDRPADPLEGP